MLQKIKFLLLTSLIMFAALEVYAETPSFSADKIKAAYTFQFTRFATWPTKISSVDTPFTICMLGNEPIAKELKSLNQYKSEGRSIRIIYPTNVFDTDDCKILYIAETKSRKLKDIIRILHNKPILTVSSIPNFALQGGIVGLTLYKNKIRLEINLASAQRADIKLSAKLLEIASVITDTSNKEEQP